MPKEATGKTGMPTEKRNKARRPRDELGRPLGWDAENKLEMEDFDLLTLEQNHEVARGYVRAGNYFPAHEAWETAWKQARNTDEAEFFKGLSQMGAGYVHMKRGNPHGTITLLRRAAGRVGRYPEGHRGIRTKELEAKLEADAQAVEEGRIVPGEGAVFADPEV